MDTVQLSAGEPSEALIPAAAEVPGHTILAPFDHGMHASPEGSGEKSGTKIPEYREAVYSFPADAMVQAEHGGFGEPCIKIAASDDLSSCSSVVVGDPSGTGAANPARMTLLEEQRKEMLEELAPIFADVFEAAKANRDLRDGVIEALRNYLLPNDPRKKIVVGNVVFKRYDRQEARCACHMEPLNICKTAVAGESVRVLIVTMPPSFDVSRSKE